MSLTQFHLLHKRRFLPLFITQFLNAFNDNVFKNAFVILITFSLTQTRANEQLMISIIGGVFILPFLLFSATAGQVADKYEKSQLVRYIKFAEILIMLIGSLGFYFQQVAILLFTLFLLGMHSTFFGPIKYAMLPEHLQKQELIAGNALIEAGTFLAILLGQVLGGSLILTTYGILAISLTLLSIALGGWLSSLSIPQTRRAAPHITITANIFKETWRIMALVRKKSKVHAAITGISWFWFIGATFITQFPTFTKITLFSNASVFTLFLTVFSLGIGVGSLFCNSLLRGKITANYAPLCLLGMSLFILIIYFIIPRDNASVDHLLTLMEFFHSRLHLLIIIALFLMSACAGLFVVPLYAYLQEHTDRHERSRMLAGNNIINALYMVASAVYTIILSALGLTMTQLFLVTFFCNLLMTYVMAQALTPHITQHFLKWALRLLYK